MNRNHREPHDHPFAIEMDDTCDPIDWKLVVKTVAFFVVVLTAYWWCPALVEWARPKP